LCLGELNGYSRPLGRLADLGREEKVIHYCENSALLAHRVGPSELRKGKVRYWDRIEMLPGNLQPRTFRDNLSKLSRKLKSCGARAPTPSATLKGLGRPPQGPSRPPGRLGSCDPGIA